MKTHNNVLPLHTQFCLECVKHCHRVRLWCKQQRSIKVAVNKFGSWWFYYNCTTWCFIVDRSSYNWESIKAQPEAAAKTALTSLAFDNASLCRRSVFSWLLFTQHSFHRQHSPRLQKQFVLSKTLSLTSADGEWCEAYTDYLNVNLNVCEWTLWVNRSWANATNMSVGKNDNRTAEESKKQCQRLAAGGGSVLPVPILNDLIWTNWPSS